MVTTVYEALAEPTRRRILDLLRDQPRLVGELVTLLDMSQPGVSKHLRVLREAGLLEQEKQGQQRLYALGAEFTDHLAENNHMLDLGCCQFDFNKLPA